MEELNNNNEIVSPGLDTSSGSNQSDLPTGSRLTAKKRVVILAVLVLILLVVAMFVLSGDLGIDKNIGTTETKKTEQNTTSKENVEKITIEKTPVTPEEAAQAIASAVVEAPGANLITPDGRVVDYDGNEVKNDVLKSDPRAPQQTGSISLEQVPFATKLELSAAGFSPKEFKIKKGEPLTISLSGSNDSSHVFKFEDKSLSAIGINVRAGETRAVTFKAPEVAGSYKFFCDFPGHIERGEIGVMIVE
jgi:plastocyanin